MTQWLGWLSLLLLFAILYVFGIGTPGGSTGNQRAGSGCNCTKVMQHRGVQQPGCSLGRASDLPSRYPLRGGCSPSGNPVRLTIAEGINIPSDDGSGRRGVGRLCPHLHTYALLDSPRTWAHSPGTS